jgi:hypothetical protein
MRSEVKTIEDEDASDEARRVDILLRAVRAAIRGVPDPELPGRASRLGDLLPVNAIAKQNKLSLIMADGLALSGVQRPEDYRQAVQNHRNMTVMLNTLNLSTIRHCVPMLVDSGIDTIVFKGPLHQQAIFGTYFMRPSTDLDLLVADADFDRASRLLREAAFELPENCQSPWWRTFLGEQHFLSLSGGRTTIDLHHRVQQPGCPAPRLIGEFFSNAETRVVGTLPVRTLSRVHRTLLAAIGLVKAVFHREPAGAYACDIAKSIQRSDRDELENLVETARRQGLLNTLLFGLRAAGLLFDIDAGGSARPPLARTSDAELLRMLLMPWGDEIDWPKRRRFLWELCDPQLKMQTFVREMAWALSGELCRRIYEPRREAEPAIFVAV